jgi:hypothetical protein
MCPFCLATAALIAGSATGTGGLTALVAGAFIRRKKREQILIETAVEVNDGNDGNRNRESESGVAR